LPRRLSVSGHAGFSDDEHGGDIVCAAVSALVGYLGIAFSEIVPEMARVSADDGSFQLEVEKAHVASMEIRVLIETFMRAVRQLEENYQGWVKVEERKWIQESP
jgi:uncharacterized protein YsxB (DUF464 family)